MSKLVFLLTRVMKSLALAGLAFSLGLSLAAAPKRIVRVAVFPHSPAVFMGPDGEANGFLVEMVRAVASREAWELRFVPGTWEQGIARARAGEVDLITSVARTPEREAFLSYGQESAFTVWSLLYANPKVPITSLLDVRDRRVGLMREDLNGRHFRDLVQQFNLPCAFVEYGTFPEVMAAVASGQVDVGVTSNTYGYTEESHYRVVRTPVVFDPFPLYFATPKGGGPALLAALDAYFREGKADPASGYHQAIERWMPTGAPQGFPSWLAHLGLTVLALLAFAVLAALAFRLQVQRATAKLRIMAEGLEQELHSRKLMEEQIIAVAEAVGLSSGAAFLDELVRHLALAAEADVAFVGELVSREGVDRMRTMAVFMEGHPGELEEWALKGSASEKVLKDGLCVYPSGIQAAFPEDPGLRRMGFESYVGTALTSSKGQVLGLIGVMNRRPLSNPTFVASLLRIFSARAASELERRDTEAASLILERQMQHAQKLESLGVLAGGIAHDFNNLMTAMLGHLNVAQLQLAPDSPATPHLDSLEKIILRAADLTRQMLAYSGKGRFVVRPYDLNHVVQEVTHLLEVAISKKVALRFDLTPALPLVEADAAQIQQVIMNLVTNAADAIGDHAGTIRLSTSTIEVDRIYLDQVFQGQNLTAGTYVCLEVGDTGCGMAPEVLARIFDPFFTTKVAGRGLGLSATVGILKGHRAGMRIYSEPGRGTTFKLLFPSSEVQQEEESGQIATLALVKKATVLLVDDEEMIREAASAVLESIGLTVICAADGQEALDVVQGGLVKVDVVLMDLTMPRMDGREAFRALHRTHPELPVILCSGYNEQECTQEFVGRGLAAFLQKPYTLRSLETMVLEVLARRD